MARTTARTASGIAAPLAMISYLTQLPRIGHIAWAAKASRESRVAQALVVIHSWYGAGNAALPSEKMKRCMPASR